jgi:hypothetical protein
VHSHTCNNTNKRATGIEVVYGSGDRWWCCGALCVGHVAICFCAKKTSQCCMYSPGPVLANNADLQPLGEILKQKPP